MKSLVFVTLATATLALGGCNRNNQDAVQNAELNQSDAELNDIANQAAMDAAANAEAANLAAQQNLLNAENAAAQDKTVNPREADEQNVSGM
jgi:hypothetical protein